MHILIILSWVLGVFILEVLKVTFAVLLALWIARRLGWFGQ
jgi:hypothetical protein